MAVMWLPPIIDLGTTRPTNVSQLWRALGHPNAPPVFAKIEQHGSTHAEALVVCDGQSLFLGPLIEFGLEHRAYCRGAAVATR